MFGVALSIGLFSYVVLFLGIFGQLFAPLLFAVTIFYWLVVVFIFRRKIKFKIPSVTIVGILFLFLIIVNFIGALGPELSFDALWYHLTIPKLFSLSHRVYFIPGGLFYYSLMPKLTEMLYTVSLVFSFETGTKLIHFTFGILTCWALFKLARLYLSKKISFLAVLVFYSNLVVDWLSTTAYTDLSRAFFETGAIFYLLLYTKNKQNKNLIKSAILLGFAISVKLLSLGTIPIFLVMIFMISGLSLFQKLQKSLMYILVSLAIPLPWFVISFYYTKNPFFPLFTQLGLRNFTPDLLSPIVFVKTFITTFLFSADPISPFYLIALFIVGVNIKKLFIKYSYLMVFTILSFLVWYSTSQSGGTRFLTAYIPVYTVLGFVGIMQWKSKRILSFITFVVILVALVSIIYRGAANARYIPSILGLQTRQDFLMKHLNFSFGDFYDENGIIKKIVGENTVLLINMHNLFYVDFPFTLVEWKSSKPSKYILVQDVALPAVYSRYILIYKNDKTHVRLYKL